MTQPYHKRTSPDALKRWGRRYPWDQWFLSASTEPLTLVHGRDYVCRTDTMAVQVRQTAARKGLHVSVQIGEEMDKLIIVVLGS